MAALIGKATVFQAYFLDEDNVPFNPTVGPTLDLFVFSDAGVKTFLVEQVDMSPVEPEEVGRFVYSYTVPTSLEEGLILYVEIRAQNEVAEELLKTDQRTVCAIKTLSQGLAVSFV